MSEHEGVGTWRIFPRDEDPFNVEVTRRGLAFCARSKGLFERTGRRHDEVCASEPVDAVLNLLWLIACLPREVLAPGELSADERVAAITARMEGVVKTLVARGDAAREMSRELGQGGAVKVLAKAGVYHHAASIVALALREEETT